MTDQVPARPTTPEPSADVPAPSPPDHEPPPQPSVQRVRGPRIARGALVIAATTAIVASAAMALAASPSADPESDASPTPGATFDEGTAERVRGGPGGAIDRIGVRFGAHLGGLDITITSIDGSQLSLRTDNGWTRTIDATGVSITDGDEEVALGELSVGDQVALREERDEDGTWSVAGIHVIPPHVAGVVTDVGADTITVEAFDGTAATVAVTDETTFTVQGSDDAGLGDIEVDDLVVARGELDASGTLVASEVRVGIGRPGFMHRGGPFGRVEGGPRDHIGQRWLEDGVPWLDDGAPWLEDDSNGSNENDPNSKTDAGAGSDS